MERCPLKIAVYQPDNKDRVSVIQTSAVVYRRSDGRYFVLYGNFRFAVTFHGNTFIMVSSARDWLLCFPHKMRTH